MRHFEFLATAERDRLFHSEPQPFAAGDDLNRLAVCLGATLYSPATRPQLAADIARRTANGVTSAVVCLEDSIADHELAGAELNAVAQLREFALSDTPRPLLFLRVRAPEQIIVIAKALGDQLSVLTGFVLPKFTEDSGPGYLDAIADVSQVFGQRLLAMPVLESPQMIHAETRVPALLAVRDLLAGHRDMVLAVRIGATDLSAAYGLRRPRDVSVYDVRVLADVISDVVNVFSRADGSGYVVTGPVWEYYAASERMFRTQLRASPFNAHSERDLRADLIDKDLDGLIREVVLDQANGLTGKTVIHPNHVAAVHALSVVSQEEYCDAMDILGTNVSGGVAASPYRNKMNESKPHTAWAHRICQRADVFGVANESISFVDLLSAGLQR